MRLSYRKIALTVVLAIILLSFTSTLRRQSDVEEEQKLDSAGEKKTQTYSVKPVSRALQHNVTVTPTNYRHHDTGNTSVRTTSTKHEQGNFPGVTLPWSILRTQYLPNFYTQIEINETKRYAHSTVIYLHHNKAAGTTTKKCLSSIASKAKRKIGTILSSQGRTLLERSKKSQPARLKSDIYMGGYAFGVCDHLTHKPCSYFTVLRDPYERLISSYSYCRRARTDQICSALGANDVSIEEWAMHQGSFFFQQLLFDPNFCTTHFMRNNNLTSMDGIAHDIIGYDRMSAAPCWFRQKVIMHNALNADQSELLLNYCLENLERWFAVIGLVEDYDTSLTLLEDVYKIPFKKCASRKAENKSNYLNLQEVHKGEEDSKQESLQLNKLKSQLQQDPAVTKALEADVRLYEKAREIFERQKKIFKERTRQL